DDVGQAEIAGVVRCRCFVGLFRRHATTGDIQPRFAGDEAGLADTQVVADFLGATFDQLFRVKVHTVGRFVLDPLPQRLEVVAEINSLVEPDPAPVVSVLDIEPAGDFAQHAGDGGGVFGHVIRQGHRIVDDVAPQAVLYLAFGV